MIKPDFKELKTNLRTIAQTDAALDAIFAKRDEQAEAIRSICDSIGAVYAKDALVQFSAEELKNAKAGIRVQALIDAGYKDLRSLAEASDMELMSVEGIGEKQVASIRHIVAEFANSLAGKYSIRLEAEDDGKSGTDNAKLIALLYKYNKCETVRKDAEDAASNLKSFREKCTQAKIVRNGLTWLIAGAQMKERTVMMADDVSAFCSGAFFERLLHIIDMHQEALQTSDEEAMTAFKANGADFYALLEKIDGTRSRRSFVYDSIPAALAEEVGAEVLDLKHFTGNLRSYQEFGVKYIIHQKYVLLGDEMGLGKTIQAIAAMSEVASSSDGTCHFLVICPASILINWAREIGKFSDIEAYILHGQKLEDTLSIWKENGGAAITNYESLGKIVDKIDEKMKLAMLIVDEAHYMKNPDAQRTKYIKRLDNESDRIVMMTGTPLENRVEEMCSLISFIRPDMEAAVRSMAHISHLSEFKEKLSPMYLRRTRKQVLKELPSMEEKIEWCEMTDLDRDEYIMAVRDRSFMKMRRLSFLQDDMENSAKARRLIELCDEAIDEGRKAVVYSFFRETVGKVSTALGDRCIGVISGDTKIEGRQGLLDRFAKAEGGAVIVCQIQAGGIGLNIQAASIVIFCEPQIKPSLTWQALSRVYRMGQVRNVLVYHLLCPGTVDDEMTKLLEEKKFEFENFADESAVAEAFDNIMDKDWIQKVIEDENRKYLPAVI
ncbi:MAG: DEAD/DEAH box helicase family protein [Lachnospiraceae bacterium]|nr:DEAD/DEAH box helicase family protein [Lachnospiraceae bacterium]